MKCRQVSELISWFVEGDLPPQKAEAVRMHIAGCDACRAELSAEQVSAKALASPRMVFDAPDVLADIKARAAQPGRPSVGAKWQWVAAGLAAVCCLVWLGATLILTHRDPSPVTAAAPPVEKAQPHASRPAPTIGKTAKVETAGEMKGPVHERLVQHSHGNPVFRHPKRYAATVRRAPSSSAVPAPAHAPDQPAPKIEYLVVYEHPGLGDGMAAPGEGSMRADVRSAASGAGSYSIRMTDESTGTVTNLSVDRESTDEAPDSVTVRFGTESTGSLDSTPERSSIDEETRNRRSCDPVVPFC